jgi:uncharacterized membrane protein YjgN (DUF898 family)
MDIIYTLAGILLMLFTCFITWINWKILRVSEELLVVSQVLLQETVQVRKQLTTRTKSTKKLNMPISGTKTR